MSEHDLPTRRGVLALFASFATLFPAPGRSASSGAKPLDQGIGGAGAAPAPNEGEGDKGIGGTGVIGTIRRFGSIIINDLRIAYPKDVVVTVDGAPASARALKIGQVVRVVAKQSGAGLATCRIEVASEVVGPIESVSAKHMTVLKQSVSLDDVSASDRRWREGDHVAVSGLRQLDGTIAASLIEHRAGDASRIAGLIEQASNGALTLGALRLSGVEPALIGRRAILEGRLIGDMFYVAQGQSERSLLGSEVRTVSLETYVERAAGGLRLGSGFSVIGGAGASLPRSQAVRAVITTSVEPGGQWRVETVRPDPRQGNRGGPSGTGPSGSGPRGSGPSGSDHGVSPSPRGGRSDLGQPSPQKSTRESPAGSGPFGSAPAGDRMHAGQGAAPGGFGASGAPGSGGFGSGPGGADGNGPGGFGPGEFGSGIGGSGAGGPGFGRGGRR